MRTLAVIGCVLFVWSCGDDKPQSSTCARYGRMEAKCGDFPDKERADTAKVAEAFCIAAHRDKEEDVLAIRAESVCADKHTDCKSYKACTKAASKKQMKAMTKDIDDEIKAAKKKIDGEVEKLKKLGDGAKPAASPTKPAARPTKPAATPTK